METRRNKNITNSSLRAKLIKLDTIRHYDTPYIADNVSDREQILEGFKMKYGMGISIFIVMEENNAEIKRDRS